MLVFFVFLCSLSYVKGRNCHCRIKPADEAFPPLRHPPKPSGPSVGLVDEVVADFDPSSTNEKVLEVKNSCSFDVMPGVTGSDKGVSKKGVCPENQKDNGEGRCFWYLDDLPKALKPGKSWSTVLRSEDDHLFSGNVWGVKVGMMEIACPSSVCLPWVGPKGAVTKAEFTLSKKGLDYYDVSIIEGSNIPVAMKPLDVPADPNDMYKCGIAGGCTWEFEPEPDLEKYVTQVVEPEPKTICETSAECTLGKVCGATFDTRPPVYGVCGKFNGYASAHVNCLSGSTGAPFFCEDNSNVISCMGDYNLSGYNQPPGTKVCGCIDWEALDIDAPTHIRCETTDRNWEEKSLPFLKFLKTGCPLSYVFAYDDFTGVATCGTSRAYSIEFCPGDSENSFFGK